MSGWSAAENPNKTTGWTVYNEYGTPVAGNLSEDVAALLVVAPDLLEAATAMFEAFGDELWVDHAKAQALDKLMGAINKAEGSS